MVMAMMVAFPSIENLVRSDLQRVIGTHNRPPYATRVMENSMRLPSSWQLPPQKPPDVTN